MTNHTNRSITPGPRWRQRQAELRLRLAMLDSGRTGNLTVLLAMSANEAATRRRARITKGGDGQTPPMSTDTRTDVYVACLPVDGLSTRQTRQLVRMSARIDSDRTIREMTSHRGAGMATANGYTPPKGRPTAKRAPVSTKGLAAGAQL